MWTVEDCMRIEESHVRLGVPGLAASRMLAWRGLLVGGQVSEPPRLRAVAGGRPARQGSVLHRCAALCFPGASQRTGLLLAVDASAAAVAIENILARSGRRACMMEAVSVLILICTRLTETAASPLRAPWSVDS